MESAEFSRDLGAKLLHEDNVKDYLLLGVMWDSEKKGTKRVYKDDSL